MRNLSKFLAFAAALACPFLSAHADQLSISGSDTFTSGTITAVGPYATTGTGTLFGGLTGGSIVFAPVAIIYTTPSYPAFPVFTVTSGADTLTFFSVGGTYSLTPYQASANGATTTDLSLVVDAHGYFTGNYFDGQLPGTLDINTSGEPSPDGSTTDVVGFTATATAPTPEPSSIALLGTGLVGTAGLTRRFRTKAVTT